MRTIHYDVAMSLNGYIAGPDEDISGFPAKGEHLDAYLKRLGVESHKVVHVEP